MPTRNVGVLAKALVSSWDVIVTVPAKEYWEIDCINVIWTSDATAGSRRPSVYIKDAAGFQMAAAIPKVTQPTLKVRNYTFQPGVVVTGLFADDFIGDPAGGNVSADSYTAYVPLPKLVVPPLGTIEIGDNAAIHIGDVFIYTICGRIHSREVY